METATGRHGGESLMDSYPTSIKTFPTQRNRMQDVCRKVIYIFKSNGLTGIYFVKSLKYCNYHKSYIVIIADM